jgi:hypothetical protein
MFKERDYRYTRQFSHNEIAFQTIPDTVNAIACGAFAHNLLTELILSHKFSVISRNTFAENLPMTLITPEGVKGIDIEAFRKNRSYCIETDSAAGPTCTMKVRGYGVIACSY